jgi:hypothetical protein
MAITKSWSTDWVDGEDILADALNRIEATGAVVFEVIYVRYSEDGKTGYRIISYKENNRDAKQSGSNAEAGASSPDKPKS